MKRILFLLVIFSLFIITSVLAEDAQPKVTLVSQSPDPVEPGEIVTVQLKIENEGDESTGDAIVKIDPKYPFSLYGDVAEKNIGKLRASSSGADAEIVSFKLKVDEKAVERETEIELAVLFGEGGRAYTNDEFLIDINTRDAILEISSIKYQPEQIPPGQKGEIKISVKNLADSLLNDITFDLNFNSVDLPLAPYESTSRRQIAYLQPNYQLPLTFQVIAKPDATPGLYKIPLNLSYYDDQGNSYRLDEVLMVRIGEKPNLKLYVKKSTVQQAKKNGKITLEVANSGMTTIKRMEMTILPSEDFELISSSNYFYLGDIDADDTESEEIDLYINGVKKLILPVKLHYYDANNMEYNEEFNLEMNLYSTWKLKKFGVITGSNTGLYVFLILIIAAGVFIYKKKPQWIPEWVRKRIPWKKK